ncbi:hypothetical protein N9P53_04775, partial [Flavobacteriaceae bacterium]|nr:hypothetical protein [Flavobacteriaceae bacterium]
AFTCAVNVPTGTVTPSQAVVGVTQEIQANVTKAGTYSMTTNEANGITFANSGTLASTGIQSITLTGTGTATTEGTFTYTLNTSPACSFDREAVSTSLPAGMAITNADQTKIVVSLYDDNYLPYTAPTGPAITNVVSPDGTTETLVDIQGVIGTLGSGDELTVSLSYSATVAVAYPEVNKVVSVPSTYIEGGGGPIDLIFDYPAGTTVVGTGTITATIYAASTLNVKKLDINAGLGNDNKGIQIAQFSLAANDSGGSGTVGVNIMAGIIDRMFGKADNTGSTTSHNFIYVPVTAANGQVWLNNNLGAHYNHVDHPSFNPAQQAENPEDHLAWGSLFQWGRKPDGHELVTYTNNVRNSTGKTLTSKTTVRSNNPNHALVIDNDFTFPAWFTDGDYTRCDGVDAANNPCPEGFKVPSESDWLQIPRSTLFTDPLIADVKFTSHLWRYLSHATYDIYAPLSAYWTSRTGTTNTDRGFIQRVGPTAIGSFLDGNYGLTDGNPVRCIQD